MSHPSRPSLRRTLCPIAVSAGPVPLPGVTVGLLVEVAVFHADNEDYGTGDCGLTTCVSGDDNHILTAKLAVDF